MVNWFSRNPKNWFKKERIMQDASPKVHARNVSAGNIGSSVIGTVNLTCSIGLSFTSSAHRVSSLSLYWAIHFIEVQLADFLLKYHGRYYR
ncbi:hypothetical protein J5N97_005281 [Dioscorea zingiberensis]|uniref:Uncharacterized protein n=1 Tax=Dioscorea zingiberensis TaxID=325984 RepID=A0A9D5HRQ4_9LILI|nr:hypothetical protein J5N97_005281 [Dioscorea zingiberensis]